MSCFLGTSGNKPAGEAWADQRPAGRAAKPNFLLGGMNSAVVGSKPQGLGSPERSGTAAAVPTPGPEILLHPCTPPLQVCQVLCWGVVDVAVS